MLRMFADKSLILQKCMGLKNILTIVSKKFQKYYVTVVMKEYNFHNHQQNDLDFHHHHHYHQAQAGLRPAGPRGIVGRVHLSRVHFSRLASRLRRSARSKKARIVGNMQEFQRSNLPTFFLPFQPSNLLARRRFTAEEIAREFELTIITFDYKGSTFKQISSAVNLQCSSRCCW